MRGDLTIVVPEVLEKQGAPWSKAHIWPEVSADTESGRESHADMYYRRQGETADANYGFALDATEDGSAAKLIVSAHSYVDDPVPDRVGGGKRQRITEFSRQSRRRLQTMLASVPRSGYKPDRLLFLTLTYHYDWPDSAAGLKAHLQAWRKRVERKYGAMAMFWRLEFQGRGAPHWHLLVFAPDHLVPELSGEPQEFPFALDLTVAWNQLVAPGDLEHLLHGVGIRQANSWNGAMAYLSKYMAKPEFDVPGGSVGRVWGVWRKSLLGVTWRRWNLEYVQFIKLRRVLRRACRYRRGDYKLRGMVCFLGWSDLCRLAAFYGLALEPDPPPRVGFAGVTFGSERPVRAAEVPVRDRAELSLLDASE